MYEALCGRVPYSAESVGALAVQMMSGPPAPLAELRPDLSPELVAVVMKAIALDRDERYPSMRALIEALSPFVEQELSRTPARGSVQGRSSISGRGSMPAYSSLRLTTGDAPTLSETPSRSDGGPLRVDEVDESSRPQTAEHELPFGKIALGVVGALVLVLVGIGLARRGDSEPEAPAATAPASRTEPAPAAQNPGDPVPPSAQGPKGVPAANVEDDAPAATSEQNAAALDAAGVVTDGDQEERGAAHDHRKQRGKKRGQALTLDQMVPKAPELPAEEREQAPAAPVPAPAPAEPAPAAPPPAPPAEPAPAPAQ
jgi:serine/threonine-protein kinase